MPAKKRTEKAVTKAAIPNQDPYFFIPVAGGGSVTAQQIDEKPYQYHPWINASARTICFNVARLPHVLSPKEKPDEIEKEHEILARFKNPNPFMTEMTLWKAIILGLILPDSNPEGKENTGGQVFLVPLDQAGKPMDLTKGAVPTTLWPFTDKYFRPLRNGGKVDGWIYEVPNNPGTRQIYKYNEIIRIFLYNPYDWLKGMSWYTPSQVAVLQDIKSDLFNTMFFENDARVGGVLSSDQHLSDEQYRTYSKRWYENYGGAGNGRRTAVLGAGLKYEQMAESHSDMQFSEQKQRIQDQIIAVFGLNKIALGNYESINFATIREGRRMLWQDTYQPLDQVIWDAINDQLIRFLDGGKWIGRSDYGGIEALRNNWKTEAEAAAIMVEKLGYPPTLASRMSGLPLTDEHIEKYPWLDEEKKAPAPIMGDPDVDADEDDADDAKKKPPKKKPPKTDEDKKAVLRDLEEDRIKLSWDYIHKILDPGEKRFIRQLDRYFVSQRNRMQDKVDKWLEDNGDRKTVRDIPIVGRVVSIDVEQFLLDLMKENKTLTALWTPLVRDQMLAEQARLEEELGSLIEWNVTDERVSLFVASRREQIKGINTTTFNRARDKIADAIEAAMEQNATPQETAKMVKEALGEVGEIRKNQAKTIARTETGTISSSARYDAFRVEGIEWVEWLTAGDESVRTEPGMDHKAAGASGPIRFGNSFPGSGLRFPLDPRGEPGNVINCRCALIASQVPQ